MAANRQRSLAAFSRTGGTTPDSGVHVGPPVDHDLRIRTARTTVATTSAAIAASMRNPITEETTPTALNAAYCAPVSSISTGQRRNGRVTGARGTVYGSRQRRRMSRRRCTDHRRSNNVGSSRSSAPRCLIKVT
jgi:hypothetical protein